LNASGKVDLQLPAAATSRAPLAMLAALRGEAAMTLNPSTLVGVPLTGSATLLSGSGAQVVTHDRSRRRRQPRTRDRPPRDRWQRRG